MIKNFILLVIITALLVGCQAANPGTTVEPTPIEEQEQIQQEVPNEPVSTAETMGTGTYPYPEPTKYIPPTPRSYPGPESGESYTSTPMVIPEPGSDTGVVFGKLISSETGEPLAFQTIYLGNKIPLTPGPGYTYGLQELSSPHVMTNDVGEFAMGDVQPGKYIIMIFTPHSASVVMVPNSDREVEVVVAAGKTVDLEIIEALAPTY